MSLKAHYLNSQPSKLRLNFDSGSIELYDFIDFGELAHKGSSGTRLLPKNKIKSFLT